MTSEITDSSVVFQQPVHTDNKENVIDPQYMPFLEKSRLSVDFRHKCPVTQKACPSDDVIMCRSGLFEPTDGYLYDLVHSFFSFF